MAGEPRHAGSLAPLLQRDGALCPKHPRIQRPLHGLTRHLLDRITEGVIIVYPPRDPSPESDEGCEFAIFYEKRLAQDLINDREWSEYFEYRGVDAEDASEAKKANGTNGVNGSS